MRDLYTTAKNIISSEDNKSRSLSQESTLLSIAKRREILAERIKCGVSGASLMKDLVDPKTIPRIEMALRKMDSHVVLTEGAKPYSNLRKQQLAMKFLDVCEKPQNYSYY